MTEATPWGLYVHIPVCRSRCLYCDFYSNVAPTLSHGDYVRRLLSELERRRDEMPDCPPTTAYLGGGTPSALDTAALGRLFEAVDVLAGEQPLREFTMELNPEDASKVAAIGRDDRPSRLSMGVQSLVDAELRAVGRRHNGDDALRALETLRRAGYANISCDLIYGLPGQTPETFRHSLTRLLSEGIDHLSAYMLTYEEGTPLTRLRDKGRLTEAPEETIVDMYAALCEETAARGFEHYEISSFAAPGRRAVHNSLYWQSAPYLGLGPGAHSLDRYGLRSHNRPDLAAYLRGDDVFETDPETESERINDYIMTRLRTSDGLDTADFRRRFGDDAARDLLRRGRRAVEEGRLTVGADGIMAIAPDHRLTSDAVILELFL